MARKKAGDEQQANQTPNDAGMLENTAHVQADQNSVAVGGIQIGGDVGGSITIGHGYTAEQVSLLLTQITSNYQRKPFDGRCPYKGLEVFEEEDAELFFGRERLVAELVNRVRESRTVFITGPSGSGKSSLVRAGLLYALKQGAIKDLHSERWLYETMKPGREPLKDLALAFSRLKGPDLADYFLAHTGEKEVLQKCAESVLSGQKDQRFVLFIDQFEEVFTQVNQETERLTFLHMLAHAGTVENGRIIVLFAMRSDFVSNCAVYPMLNELLSHQFRQIGAMQPDELVSAIALPARHVGLPIEDELIARIINDMKGEPGALPLMQFALKDLFDSQQARGGMVALTLKDYVQHGGIHKSLERHADRTFAHLGEEERDLARSIFSGLIEIGRGTQDTRRTALFDELVPANTRPQEVLAVVQKLADARLIITDEQADKDTVTISHEKLIDAWPWLKRLVNENRDAIALQNEMAADAKEWEDHGRDESYLYTGARLANAREQLESNKILLGGLAQTFVDASIEAVEAERQQEEQRRQKELDDAHRLAESEARRAEIEEQRAQEQMRSAANLRKRSLYLSVALGFAILAIGFAVWFGIQSQQQAKIALARQLAALSVARRIDQLNLSFLLSLEALRHAENAGIPEEGQAVVLSTLINNPSLVTFLNGRNGVVYDVEFSPDGKILASGSGDVILWDLATGNQMRTLKTAPDRAVSLAFSPDGETIASGTSKGRIILWDVTSGKQVGAPFIKYEYRVDCLAFSPDGQILASGGDVGKVILWDVASGQPLVELLTNTNDSINSVAFSPDGRLLAIGSAYGIFLYDVINRGALEQPFGYFFGVTSVAFSPDGYILASGKTDKTIILWEMASYQPIGTTLIGHTKQVNSLVFSPDGEQLVSGSWDKSIILWDVDSHRQIGAPLVGHTDAVNAIAFRSDGYTIAAGSADTSISVWDVARHQRLGMPLSGHAEQVYSVAFSPDGKRLASGSWDSSMRLWDVTNGKLVEPPLITQYEYGINSVAFSPDGTVLALGGSDSNVILWDLVNYRQLGEPFTGLTEVDQKLSTYNVAFSPDGQTLAVSRSDNSIVLWDIASHKQLGPPLITSQEGSFICCPALGAAIAFSPDGKILASASGYTDGIIILWDLSSWQPLGPPLSGHHSPVYSLAFSPDGKTLASASNDKTIILWDVATQKQVGKPLTGHTAAVNSVAFRPDGQILASGSSDNNIILWDVARQKPLGEPLTGHMGTVISVAFSPDGKTLASGSEDASIILWDVDPDSWKEHICRIAGRNFTRSEWVQTFPNEEYHQTCEQWPMEPEPTPIPSPTQQ